MDKSDSRASDLLQFIFPESQQRNTLKLNGSFDAQFEAGNNRIMAIARVVLPAPDSPNRPTVSPSQTSRSISFKGLSR